MELLKKIDTFYTWIKNKIINLNNKYYEIKIIVNRYINYFYVLVCFIFLTQILSIRSTKSDLILWQSTIYESSLKEYDIIKVSKNLTLSLIILFKSFSISNANKKSNEG